MRNSNTICNIQNGFDIFLFIFPNFYLGFVSQLLYAWDPFNIECLAMTKMVRNDVSQMSKV